MKTPQSWIVSTGTKQKNRGYLYCIHTKKLSCLESGAGFDMNDIFYDFKSLHHFQDRLTFGVNAVLVNLYFSKFA